MKPSEFSFLYLLESLWNLFFQKWSISDFQVVLQDVLPDVLSLVKMSAGSDDTLKIAESDSQFLNAQHKEIK